MHASSHIRVYCTNLRLSTNNKQLVQFQSVEIEMRFIVLVN